MGFDGDLDTSDYRTEETAGARIKGKQNQVNGKESIESFGSAREVPLNGAAEIRKDRESKFLHTTTDEINAPTPDEEYRDAWHNCDSCGNIRRCSSKMPEAQNDHVELDGGAEAQHEALEGQTTAQRLKASPARLTAKLGSLVTHPIPRAAAEAKGKNWNGLTDYDGTIVQLGQDWNTTWNSESPSVEAGGKVETLSGPVEEESHYLLVKYDGHPFPDPGGVKINGEYGVYYTIVSDILPSAPWATVMSKILHRLKEIDKTHNPYPIAPTA